MIKRIFRYQLTKMVFSLIKHLFCFGIHVIAIDGILEKMIFEKIVRHLSRTIESFQRLNHFRDWIISEIESFQIFCIILLPWNYYHGIKRRWVLFETLQDISYQSNKQLAIEYSNSSSCMELSIVFLFSFGQNQCQSNDSALRDNSALRWGKWFSHK